MMMSAGNYKNSRFRILGHFTHLQRQFW